MPIQLHLSCHLRVSRIASPRGRVSGGRFPLPPPVLVDVLDFCFQALLGATNAPGTPLGSTHVCSYRSRRAIDLELRVSRAVSSNIRETDDSDGGTGNSLLPSCANTLLSSTTNSLHSCCAICNRNAGLHVAQSVGFQANKPTRSSKVDRHTQHLMWQQQGRISGCPSTPSSLYASWSIHL